MVTMVFIIWINNQLSNLIRTVFVFTRKLPSRSVYDSEASLQHNDVIIYCRNNMCVCGCVYVCVGVCVCRCVYVCVCGKMCVYVGMCIYSRKIYNLMET